MHFSWKMGSKMEPKSMLKSFSNDFGRSKGRPGPIVNVFRSKKDGKRMVENLCNKNDTEFGGVQTQPSSPKGPFWSRRGGKEGTSPSGSGDFRLWFSLRFNTPCTRWVRRILFHEECPPRAARVDLFYFLKGFGRVWKNVNFSMLPKIEPNRALSQKVSPPPKKKK